MPTIKLTEKPSAISPIHTMEALWEMEILAHSFYPQLDADSARKHWVEKIQRKFAQDFTTQISPRPLEGEFHRYWFAQHHFARTKNEIGNSKENESRDLNFTAHVLLLCVLERMSKREAISTISKKIHSDGGAISTNSAEATVRRAWKKYFPGCHFAAAFLLLNSRLNKDSGDEGLQMIEGISLGEKLRKIGEGTVPFHGTIPILNAAKTWKVPEWYPLLKIGELNWKDNPVSIQFDRRTVLNVVT